MKDIKSRAKAKFFDKYYCASWKCDLSDSEANIPDQIPVFSTEKTSAAGIGQSYTAENGKQATVIPGYNGTKLGVQFFCSGTLSADSPDCSQTENGLSCTFKEPGVKNITINRTDSCLKLVDKVIIGSEAVQADWYEGKYYPKTQVSIIQVLPQGKTQPTADFACNFSDVREFALTLDCDASNSNFPNGKITNYRWGDYWGLDIHSSQPTYKRLIYPNVTTTVILRVTDSEGIYDEKVKTFKFSEGGLTEVGGSKELEFTAFYNPTTKKAELTLNYCPSGTTQANIDIDLLGADGEPENAVLEKQPIKCEQTTPVNGITAPGTYQATATIAGKEKTAVFNIGPE
jgi:hypothetical protein